MFQARFILVINYVTIFILLIELIHKIEWTHVTLSIRARIQLSIILPGSKVTDLTEMS